MYRRLFQLLPILTLAACAGSKSPPPRTWALGCDQNLSAAVSIDDSTHTATVSVRGETRILQQQPSVTGELYTGNGWAVWRDGDEASLKLNYGRAHCRVASGEMPIAGSPSPIV